MQDTNLLEDQPIAWTPTADVIERAQLTKFMRQVGVSTWDELYEFSIRDVEKFTEEVIKFLDIKFDPPYENLLDTSNGIEFPNWFLRSGDTPVPTDAASASEDLFGLRPHGDKSVPTPTAGLNITTMCLDRWQTDEMKDQPAVFWEGEEGGTRTFTYGELKKSVCDLAFNLYHEGIRRGDAVGIHLPMQVETVVGLLAINRIGAIAVPVFSGYGIDAISSRLEAVGARALVTTYGFSRRGKPVDALTIASLAVGNVDSVKTVVVVPAILKDEVRPEEARFSGIDEQIKELERLKNDFFPRQAVRRWWSDKFSTSPDGLMPAEPTDAEDPLIILYTSGTTGKPKGIAHTHASFPIKAAQDMAFGTDVGKGTRICWYTDIGWMMGPWLIYGALINGATICIYDGAPDYPTPDRMWEFCAKHKVEILGISPTLIRALAAQEEQRSADTPVRMSAKHEQSSVASDGGDKSVPAPLLAPCERHDLSSLRAFASTGEPWNPAPWWWLFEKVGDSKLPIINYSGGTEIAGGILMGNPLLPQKPCSFPAPCPGMDVDILDENGEPVGAGKVGELVIKQPWIGMARGFWQEKDRYLETYWSRFKNTWVHGDWAMRDADGHWFILGRSDDTLKVAGKRVGPAEVESLLVAHPLVTEAAVIGVPDEKKGTAMVAFVVRSGDTPVPPDAAAASEARSDTTVGGAARAPLPTDGSPAESSAERRSDVRGDKSVPAPLEAELKALVARDMGKPLAPSKILFVSALPKTRNAKVMRRVIRAAYLGEDPGDLSALENPQTVDEIRDVGL